MLQQTVREQVFLTIERELQKEREKLLKIRKQIEKCETDFSAFIPPRPPD